VNDRRSTLPPPPPEPKTAIEALAYVHARLDEVVNAANGSRGASRALGIKVDALAGKVDTMTRSIDRVCEMLQRVPILESKVRELDAEVVILKARLNPAAE
jgi:hypothetical protein